MTQQTKADLIQDHRKRYKRATKKEKGQILEALTQLTGYTRKHIIHALNQDVGIPKKITRERISRYEPALEPLEKLWAVSNFLCGKRLAPFLPELGAIPETPRRDQAQGRPGGAAFVHQRSHHRSAPCALQEGPGPEGPLNHQARRRSSSTRSPSAHSPTGTMTDPGSWRSTWSPTAVTMPAVNTLTPST